MQNIIQNTTIIIDTQPLILEPPPIPPVSSIKKQLKKVVKSSNTLLDAVNELKDMKENYNIPFRKLFQQRLHISELCIKQREEIAYLHHLESFYPDEKRNRFFYFREVPIPWP